MPSDWSKWGIIEKKKNFFTIPHLLKDNPLGLLDFSLNDLLAIEHCEKQENSSSLAQLSLFEPRTEELEQINKTHENNSLWNVFNKCTIF
jgi:hypothetical protein